MIHISNDKFRGDVESLRGIAVIIVVLFHLKIRFVQSGFIGVDIFFVISGYLMALAVNSSEFSIRNFYERRARRVLPAAIIIMTLFYLIAPIFFLPFESAKLAEQAIGVMLFVPNLVFWKIDDYFSALNFAPLLHYWSLGVELQYYLLFPILVLYIKNHFGRFFGLFILSLLLCVFLTPIMSKTAFFMLPTRLWEFLLGFFSYHVNKKLITKKILTNNQRILLVSFFVILLILYACSSIPRNQFPGVYAIPAALLGFFIITVGLDNKYVEGNLGFTALRWFGKVSYSVYLIHYPIIFIFIYQPFSELKDLKVFDCVLIILITLVLSVLSYRYVEVPFRNRNTLPLNKFFLVIVATYIVLITSIFYYERENYFSSNYPQAESRVFRAMEDTGNFRCSKWQKLKEYGESSCYLSQGAGFTFYLVGDSHIDALKEAFVDVAGKHDSTVRINRSRCFLGEAQCSYEEIAIQVKKYRVSDVVLHGWDADKFNYTNLQRLIDAAKSLGVKIHIIGPVPTYSKSVPLSLFKELRNNSTIIERFSKEKFVASISSKYIEFKKNNYTNDNVLFYEPENYLCPDVCLLEDERGIYYYDDHHLTMTGASALKPLFNEIINRK